MTHTHERREREREGEKSPFSSPLLPSGRTNEREKELKWANNNNNDSSETRENEREIEKKKKERARARETTKKRSLGGRWKKKGERRSFFFIEDSKNDVRKRKRKDREKRNVSHHDVRHGRILSGD